ncbi:MAG: ribonuclease P protein component [Candidatus Krumholzibacteriota bacterium]|nr:ribonuclease P protein component [Candidatus Krumholzibacteriota bacterium]
MATRKLKKNWQFREVYQEGKREAGEKIIIYYLRTESEGILPGFVASKKNVGKAYQRNRAKRQMREIFRKLQSRFIEQNLWIVFIASFRPTETSFQELLEEVERSLLRARLISSSG